MTWSNYSISANGMTITSGQGEAPKPTPKELIATRAVESKDGWLGQIVMAGEIVHETEPQTGDDEDSGSEQALRLVNQHVLDAFKRVIVGA